MLAALVQAKSPIDAVLIAVSEVGGTHGTLGPMNLSAVLSATRDKGVRVTPQGAVGVQITAIDTTALTPALEALGMTITGNLPDRHLLEGLLPTQSIDKLLALRGEGLMGVRAMYTPITNAGSVPNQADVVHESDRVRAALPDGYDGSGIKIGVLSDSYDSLGGAAADIASGDLPAGIQVLEDDFSFGNIDEGRAMLQLIHDMAPGADLAFATAWTGEVGFAQNILNLAAAGSDVIVDDVSYFAEPMFQDGIIAQAVDSVVAGGASYFSSAGNSADRSYESTTINFAADGTSGLSSAFDFDPGAGVDTRQAVTIPQGNRITLSFQWDDPFYTTNGVDTDLDIYLVRAGTNDVVAGSTSDNLANQAPVEIFSFTNSGSASNFEIIINRFAGPAPQRLKYVDYSGGATSTEFATNSSTIFGHAAASQGIAVAAAGYFRHSTPESFSSHGTTTILFDAAGVPLGAPQVRNTPQMTAIDGTDTTFFGSDVDGNGFPNFFGTSAAAPHAAAIAALLQQANPTWSPTQIYERMQETAIDLNTPGWDSITGFGLVNAYRAIFGSAQPASLPFSDGFETGGLSQAWETSTNGTGRITLSSANSPATGLQHLALDNFFNLDQSLKEATLHLNMSGFTDIVLNFKEKELSDDDHPLPASFTGSFNGDGVSLSVDGVNWFTLVSLTGAASSETYQSFSFDLSAFAASKSLTLAGDVRIKFQEYGSRNAPADGIFFDDIQVTGTVINFAPVLDKSFSPVLDPIAEDSSDSAGTLVSQILGGVSDPDPGALQGIAVTGLTKMGVWEYSPNGGSSWLPLGFPSESAAIVLLPTDRVRLTPKFNFTGTALLYFRAWDQTDGAVPGSAVNLVGNVGGSKAYSKNWDIATLAVTPVNDAPLLDGSLSPQLDAIAEDSSGSAGTPVSQLLAGVSDVDSGAVQGIAVTSVSKVGTWEYSLDGGSSWLALGLPSESAAIVLRPTDRVRLTPKFNFNGTALLYFRAWDRTDGAVPGSVVNLVGNTGGTKAYSKNADAATLAVTPVNDAPQLDGSLSPQLNAIAEDSSGSAGTPVSQLLAGVGDVDSGAVQGIAVTGVSKVGTWEYSLDGGSSWLPLGLPSESAAIVLLPTDRVRLTPKFNFNGTALLYFRAWDRTDGAVPGSAVNMIGNTGGTKAYSKNADFATLAVTPVNDAPSLDGSLSPQLDAVAEDSSGSAGTPVSQLLAGVSDVDSGAVQGIAVTSVSKVGTWEYSLDGGSSWLALGLPSESAAIVLRPTDRVRLTPKLNFNGTALLYFRAWDRTDGAAPGSAVNLVGNTGGTKAYSKNADAAALAVTPVNDAPQLDKDFSPELDAVAENSSGSAGTPVSQLLAGVSDVDSGAVQGIAVTGVTNTGTWEYSLDGGSSWLPLGLPSESAAIVLRPTDRVRLTPKPNFNGTAQLYFRAWDQTDGAAPGNAVNLANNVGGTTAYSKNWDTAALDVTPVNDGPSLSGISGAIGYVAGAPAITVAAGAIVSDIDSAELDGGELRVWITEGADESNLLALSGSFTVDGSNQVFLGATPIGTRTSDGQGTHELAIVFNGTVTPSIVQQLIRSIAFSIPNEASGGAALASVPAARSLHFSVSDGDGEASAEALKTVNLG